METAQALRGQSVGLRGSTAHPARLWTIDLDAGPRRDCHNASRVRSWRAFKQTAGLPHTLLRRSAALAEPGCPQPGTHISALSDGVSKGGAIHFFPEKSLGKGGPPFFFAPRKLFS